MTDAERETLILLCRAVDKILPYRSDEDRIMHHNLAKAVKELEEGT